MNEPNEPIRQHFVPRMLLRNFTDAKRRLHSFDKNLQENRIRKSGVKKFCAENDIYTVYDEHGNKDFSVEKAFSDLENICAPIIRKIIETARVGKPPGLISPEKSALNLFLLCQCSRVPDWNDPILTRRFENTFRENPEILEMSKKEIDRFKREVRVRSLAHYVKNPNKKILSILENKGLTIGIAATGNGSLVIGSNPVVVDHPDYYMFGRIRKDWLPIAHDIAIALSFPRGAENLVEFGDAHIRSFNEAVFRQSTTIAGNSRELIRRVIGQ